jgi:glucose-6-phosphate dehydrogenase-like protein
VFQAPPPPTELQAYGNVLSDILSGGHRLSVSGGETEEAWRILDPIVQPWRSDSSGLGSYAAAHKGPLACPSRLELDDCLGHVRACRSTPLPIKPERSIPNSTFLSGTGAGKRPAGTH